MKKQTDRQQHQQKIADRAAANYFAAAKQKPEQQSPPEKGEPKK